MFLHFRSFISRAAVVAGAVLGLAATAQAITIQHGTGGDPFVYDSWHRELGNKGVHRSVGKVLSNGTFNGSGVLIGRRWVLTAAHVVDTANRVAFNINGRNVGADVWYTPRGWRRDFTAGNDLALVRLKRPVKNAPIARLYRGNAQNKKMTGVGFGNTGTGLLGETISDQVRRGMRNITDVTDSRVRRQIAFDFDIAPSDPLFRLAFTDRDQLNPDGTVNWDADMYPLALEGGIAHGDSGGGDFIGGRLAGIHSWAIGFANGEVPILGVHGGASYSVDVTALRRWINSVKRRSFRGIQINNARIATRGKPIFQIAPEDVFESDYLSSSNILAMRDLHGWDIAAGNSNGYVIVPEPATLGLLGVGSLALLRRRRPA